MSAVLPSPAASCTATPHHDRGSSPRGPAHRRPLQRLRHGRGAALGRVLTAYFASGDDGRLIFLSMRLLANGSWAPDLLYSPVRDRDIVLGKFLAALAFTAFTV